MTNNNIPSWLSSKEEYKPKKDSNSFVSSSKKTMLKLLSMFKLNDDTYKTREANTSCRLFGVLLIIILTAVSRNYGFVLFMIGLAIVRVALLKPMKIKALIKALAPVLFLSLIILIPSVFIGNPKTPALILSKILVCTSLAMSLNLTTPWNEITRSLKIFHLPDFIIFTFELTLKYIYILGEICSEMLSALALRSIGKNHNKKDSMSGVLGSVFIKAKNASTDTARAMECRGFNGKYVVSKGRKLTAIDFAYFVLLMSVIGVFVYLEVIV